MASVGTVPVAVLGSRRRIHSSAQKKNSLLRSVLNRLGTKIGPPMLKPKSLNRRATGRADSAGLGLLFRVQLFASSHELRKFSIKLPWKSRPPLLVTKRIWPPEERPYSAA